jgi:hypothetical protein
MMDYYNCINKGHRGLVPVLPTSVHSYPQIPQGLNPFVCTLCLIHYQIEEIRAYLLGILVFILCSSIVICLYVLLIIYSMLLSC